MTTLKRIVGEEAGSNFDDSHYSTLEELNLRDIATAIDGTRSTNEVKNRDNSPQSKGSIQNRGTTGRRFWFW